jgi:hypothetical protein
MTVIMAKQGEEAARWRGYSLAEGIYIPVWICGTGFWKAVFVKYLYGYYLLLVTVRYVMLDMSKVLPVL